MTSGATSSSSLMALLAILALRSAQSKGGSDRSPSDMLPRLDVQGLTPLHWESKLALEDPKLHSKVLRIFWCSRFSGVKGLWRCAHSVLLESFLERKPPEKTRPNLEEEVVFVRVRASPVLPLGEELALDSLSEPEERWEVLLPPNFRKKDMVILIMWCLSNRDYMWWCL